MLDRATCPHMVNRLRQSDMLPHAHTHITCLDCGKVWETARILAYSAPGLADRMKAIVLAQAGHPDAPKVPLASILAHGMTLADLDRDRTSGAA